MPERVAGLVAAYVELAHAIARHAPDVIDAYYGPRAWAEVEASSLAELAGDADGLLERLGDIEDTERRAYLAGQVRAMRTTLALLMGREVPFRREVELLYDVTAEEVPESRLAQLRSTLEDLLPGDGTAADRLERLAAAERVPEAGARPLFDAILAELRRRSRQRFPLPEGEHVELRLVRDKHWSGYHTYLGSYTSRVEVNIDQPLRLHALPELLAHHAYPGHHTEQAIKERFLVGEQGRLEHTLLLISAPASTVSEAVAETALSMVFGQDELRAWLAEELAPMAALPRDAVTRMHDASRVHRRLSRGASVNAALLLLERGVGDDEAIAYLQEQALATRQEAERAVRSLRVPRAGSYVFTYLAGWLLLQRLFAVGEPATLFARVLAEPVTPAAIRGWLEAAPEHAAPADRAADGDRVALGDQAAVGDRAVAGPEDTPADQAAPADRVASADRAASADQAAPGDRATPADPAVASPAATGTAAAPGPRRSRGPTRASGRPASVDRRAPEQTPAAPEASAGGADTVPATAAAPRPPSRDLTPVLSDLELELGGTLGVAAHALRGGSAAVGEGAVAYRPEERFPAASTIKVFILHTLLDRVAAGEANLDEELVLGSSDQVTGSGVLKALTPGSAYSLRDLATLMIVVSDNTAANMLIQRLGVSAVNEVAAAHGWTGTTLVGLLQRPDLRAPEDERVSTTSPRDLADHFARLWAGELLPPELTAAAQAIYRRQQLTNQLGRFLPYDPDSAEAGEGPVIASKSGSLRGVRNEAGVVEASAGGYVLAVMTRDCPDRRFHLDNRGSLVVSKVSRLLFQRFVGR